MDSHIRDMAVFVALAESGNLKRTANTLGMHTSTVAAAIHIMEARLGTTLLNIGEESCTLTPVGRQYLAICRDFGQRAAFRYQELLQDLAKPPQD